MKRITNLTLAALLSCLAASCQTEQSVPADKQVSPTPEPTTTPTPTPTPEPLVLEGAYHVTSMTVATSKSQAIDIDGDGKPDYGLESALNEISRFMAGRISNIVDQLVATGVIDQQTGLALKAAAQAAFKEAFNVNNVDDGLATMLNEQQWVQALTSTGETSVSLEFSTSTPAGQETYYVAKPLGDPFEGTFDEADMEIDASGGTVTLAVPLVTAGPQPLMMDLPLENCRDIQPFEPGAGLDNAKLGGAIPIGAVVDVVTKMMDMVGILGLMPEDMVTQMQNDVENFITGLGDVTVNGKEAISVSLDYDADPVVIK